MSLSGSGRAPYAPIPASLSPSRVSLGAWFQKREGWAQILAVIGIICGGSYLIWRVLVTSHNVPLWAFAPLFIAEVYGYASFLIFVLDSWRLPASPRLPIYDTTCDVIIPTYNEDTDILEPTIIGATQIRGTITVWLLDDGNRKEMKALAERYGIKYLTRVGNEHAKAGNINAALPNLKGELLLVLDADHVAAPDFLEATSGYFVNPKVALVQTAHSFRNHNSIMHEEEGRNEQSLFFDVLLPGRNRLKSVFWCGSAALLRRSALMEIGGLATVTVTEDYETSLHLRLKGYLGIYHNEHLIQGLAPDNLTSYVIQRFRWAQGNLQLFRPSMRLPWRKELGVLERISNTGGLLYYLSPFQKLIYSANLVAVVFFGVLPVGYVGGWFIVFWGIASVTNIVAVTALERGTTSPVEGVRNLFLSFEAYFRATSVLWTKAKVPFLVTPKNEVDLGGWASVRQMRFAIAIGSVSFLAVINIWISYISYHFLTWHYLGRHSISTVLIISFFGLMEVTIITRAAWSMYHRSQERTLWRFPVSLEAYVNGVLSKCVDLHQNGAGIITTELAMEKSLHTRVEIACHDLSGNIIWAKGDFRLRSKKRVDGTDESIRIGGRITWDTAEAKTAVIMQCYVVEQYVARQHFWLRHEKRRVVLLPANIDNNRGECVDVSTSGASFIVDAKSWGDRTVGSRIPVSVDDRFLGIAEIRNVTPTADGKLRLGASVAWQNPYLLKIFSESEKVEARERRSISVGMTP
ncbi:MAG: glycosyltransferase [Actinomycetes bacterium]